MRDAVKTQEFYFRKSLVPEDEEEEGGASDGHTHQQPVSHDHEYTQMSVDTIINGKVVSGSFSMGGACACGRSSAKGGFI